MTDAPIRSIAVSDDARRRPGAAVRQTEVSLLRPFGRRIRLRTRAIGSIAGSTGLVASRPTEDGRGRHGAPLSHLTFVHPFGPNGSAAALRPRTAGATADPAQSSPTNGTRERSTAARLRHVMAGSGPTEQPRSRTLGGGSETRGDRGPGHTGDGGSKGGTADVRVDSERRPDGKRLRARTGDAAHLRDVRRSGVRERSRSATGPGVDRGVGWRRPFTGLTARPAGVLARPSVTGDEEGAPTPESRGRVGHVADASPVGRPPTDVGSPPTPTNEDRGDVTEPSPPAPTRPAKENHGRVGPTAPRGNAHEAEPRLIVVPGGVDGNRPSAGAGGDGSPWTVAKDTSEASSVVDTGSVNRGGDGRGVGTAERPAVRGPSTTVRRGGDGGNHGADLQSAAVDRIADRLSRRLADDQRIARERGGRP